jgi:hypothetical protein
LSDPGVLEGLSDEAAAELRMFLIHYRMSKADAEIPVRINFHDGIIKALWVGGRRFELDPKKLRN